MRMSAQTRLLPESGTHLFAYLMTTNANPSTITITSTSTLRVDNHNNWPLTERFPCEKEFIERLARQNVQQIFVTAALTPDDADEPFNAAVSHILDCLDSLPMRPDAAFDDLYKVIDQNMDIWAKTNISRVATTVDALFQAHPAEWTAITEMLAIHFPQQTADYAASRSLDCHIHHNPPHSGKMIARATRSLGPARYNLFRTKYLVQNPQNASVFDLPYGNRRKAGQLMRKLFRDGTALPNPGASFASAPPQPTLDLSVQGNFLLPREKLDVLMDVCLSTYRHERFHGQAFSPFRSSKAQLKTYAHAYYLLMVAYIVLLGMLELQGKGGLTIAEVYDTSKKSMMRFSSFFGATLDE
jgi:hypothetical protein